MNTHFLHDLDDNLNIITACGIVLDGRDFIVTNTSAHVTCPKCIDDLFIDDPNANKELHHESQEDVR